MAYAPRSVQVWFWATFLLLSHWKLMPFVSSTVQVFPPRLHLPTYTRSQSQLDTTYSKEHYKMKALHDQRLDCYFELKIKKEPQKLRVNWRVTPTATGPLFPSPATAHCLEDAFEGGLGSVKTHFSLFGIGFNSLRVNSSLSLQWHSEQYHKLFARGSHYVQCSVCELGETIIGQKQAYISIHSPPVIWESQMQTFYHLHYGDTANLSCLLTREEKHDSDQSVFEWNSDSVVQNVNLPFYGRSLLIANVTYSSHDGRRFWCHVRNEWGHDTTVVIVRVRPRYIEWMALLGILLLLLILIVCIQRDRIHSRERRRNQKHYEKLFPNSTLALDGKPKEPEYRQQFV